jgi:hypothetical protein
MSSHWIAVILQVFSHWTAWILAQYKRCTKEPHRSVFLVSLSYSSHLCISALFESSSLSGIIMHVLFPSILLFSHADVSILQDNRPVSSPSYAAHQLVVFASFFIPFHIMLQLAHCMSGSSHRPLLLLWDSGYHGILFNGLGVQHFRLSQRLRCSEKLTLVLWELQRGYILVLSSRMAVSNLYIRRFPFFGAFTQRYACLYRPPVDPAATMLARCISFHPTRSPAESWYGYLYMFMSWHTLYSYLCAPDDGTIHAGQMWVDCHQAG